MGLNIQIALKAVGSMRSHSKAGNDKGSMTGHEELQLFKTRRKQGV